MKNKIKIYKKRRNLFKDLEVKRTIYKSIIKNATIPLASKLKASIKLCELSRNSSITRVKNRCILTGRPKSVYRQFRISRICFRELASNGLLTGVFKSSW
jgi:ribosomal protein S14